MQHSYKNVTNSRIVYTACNQFKALLELLIMQERYQKPIGQKIRGSTYMF